MLKIKIFNVIILIKGQPLIPFKVKLFLYSLCHTYEVLKEIDNT